MHTKLNSLFPGAKHYHFDEIDSTNKFALDLLSKSTPHEGTVISADFQTQGRGQYGRQWLSSATKNLLFSIILKPVFLPLEDQFALSRCIAIAIRNVIIKYLPNTFISIKWPNDIFCNSQKIAGILIQNNISGKTLQSSVAGIGINVNQNEFPNDLHATSILNQRKKKAMKDEVAEHLISEIHYQYNILKSDRHQLYKEYNQNLYGKEEIFDFADSNDLQFKAKVLFVNKEGNLILEKDKKYASFGFGEITWILR